MTRTEIEAFFDEAAKLEEALGGMIHREAAPALKALDEMRGLVGEELPGGYYGKCIGCEEVMGNDEMVRCGDEDLCTSCVARHTKEQSAA